MPNTRAKIEHFFTEVQPAFNLTQDLTSKIGDGALEPIGRSTTLSKANVAKLPIAVEGRLHAHLRTYEVAEVVEVYSFAMPEGMEPSDPESLGLLPGSESRPEDARPGTRKAFTELYLNVGAGALATVGAPTLGLLKASLEAAASAGIQYRLLLPAPDDMTKAEALVRLASRARPPHLVDLRDLEPSELHTLDTRVHVRFELSIEGGKKVDFEAVIKLFDGLSPTIKAHAEATLHASLGWSLYEHMQLNVGKVNVSEAGRDWVRLRLQRLRRSELTLGAKLALQVEYDLGQGAFVAVLDRMLGLEPVKRLFAAVDRIEALGIHEIDSAEEWEALKETLDARLAELILEYLDVEGLVGQLPWDEVRPFFEDIAEIVSAYQLLDEKILSLWEGLLGRVDLGPGSKIRRSLEAIATLDASDLEAARDRLLSPALREALDLFEALSGSEVEEVVIDANAARIIERARALALEALDFLDRFPAVALERLQGFARRSGVDGVAAWLEKNATSEAALRKALAEKATGTIRGVVGRLVDKAWDALDDEDLAKIRAWAERLVDILGSAKRDEHEARIRGALAKLAGEAGFSIGVEIGRLTERAALIDVELDTGKSEIRGIAKKALEEMSAQHLINSLPDPGSRDDDEDIGYRLRDSVFSYRRVRTSALSTLFTILGIDRARQTVRVDDEVIRIRPEVERPRVATYAAGAVRRMTDRGNALASSHELGVWVSLALEGRGRVLDRPYDVLTGQALRVAYARADAKTDPDELLGLDRLFQDIGFQSAESTARLGELVALGDKLHTELSFSIEMGGGCVRALFGEGDEDLFARDFRNAAHRWFLEPLIDRKSGLAASKPLERELLASIVRHPRFAERWRGGMDLIFGDDGSPWNLDIGLSVPITVDAGSGRVSRVKPLTSLLMTVHKSLAKMGEATEAYAAAIADGGLKPRDIRLFGKKAATLLGRTPFRGWDTPLFNVWLLLARVARTDPASLPEARGLAGLRYRRSGSNEEWRETLYWRLAGARVHEPGPDVFPFA